MKIGYARVSTQEQNLDLQIDALTTYWCEKIYQEPMRNELLSQNLFANIEEVHQAVTEWAYAHSMRVS
ncbi:MAG: recombinase family protein [Nitrosomonas sp.]|nr:recombinase family protein [Nitrosomonas sp.]